ncbi:MAG: DNA adenine methylase [Bacteroidia bacterium]|nr:DNA adenine methylase [Bacteroidia bacterium]MDW8236441.1 DNA adenine methylase [Bacteroidia bacterium]
MSLTPLSAPIETESIKYIGSKQKLLPYILALIQRTGAKRVLDGFTGSTRVAQALARQGYRVIANDIAVWSEVLATAYLCNPHPPSHYLPLIQHLNHTPPRDGWFTQTYGALIHQGRKAPWQLHNLRKLDGIREEIEKISDITEKSVALTSLMLALDKVDNTLGHFASYLRYWAPRSYDTLVLQIPKIPQNSEQHQVFRRDILELIPGIEIDLAYFDPPYGSNNEKMPSSRVRYAAYYHLWTTVCLHDRPEVFGKALRRRDSRDTETDAPFESFRTDTFGRPIALLALEKLLSSVRAEWILLSYNSEGKLPLPQLLEVAHGIAKKVEVFSVNYKHHVMAKMHWNGAWLKSSQRTLQEYLLLIQK